MNIIQSKTVKFINAITSHDASVQTFTFYLYLSVPNVVAIFGRGP